MARHELRIVGDVELADTSHIEPLRRAAGLEDVMRWAHATGAEIIEVIVQDELTHDVVVYARDVFIVLDTT